MLHHFDPSHFLQNHWQKSPCLIKQALSRPPQFVSPDELAGLSMDEDVESRIVSNIDNQWQLQHGPFDQSTFSQLPESNWTLLVQTLDFWVPEINELLKQFKFIPRWRFDDVMVSYATDGGGVGPHFDNYDVFLLQTEGERRWRVGAKGDLQDNVTIIPGLCHQPTVNPVIDVIMQPGDILYIPPETAHWGESIGESMGYSIGYRSPQTKDIFALLANYLDGSSANHFFEDAYRASPNPNNQIEPELVNWASEQLINIANNQELVSTILSRFLSESKIDTVQFSASTDFIDIENIQSIQLVSGINCNWLETENAIRLNIEGESIQFPAEFKPAIETLCGGETLEIPSLQPLIQKFDFSESLSSLVNKGYFLIKD